MLGVEAEEDLLTAALTAVDNLLDKTCRLEIIEAKAEFSPSLLLEFSFLNDDDSADDNCKLGRGLGKFSGKGSSIALSSLPIV